MPSVAHLLRPDIAALEPYTPAAPFEVLAERLGLPIEQIVKLDANENPYGPSPRALAALAAYPHYAIYPDPDHALLRAALSRYTGHPAERIICGAGSDELIDLLMRAFLQPGDSIIDCPPTFGMYAFDAGVQGARVVSVPRGESFELDPAAIAAAAERSGAKLLFVTSPNNPTGSITPRAVFERLLELPLLVVVDEAYAEFAGESVASLVGRYPNLAVLRTFSKWAGLAGLRIGYGLIHEELIAHLWKIKQPYNINVAAQAAALASLEDRDYLMGNVARIVAERERLYQALRALPRLHVYPSRANFLLCRVRPTTTDDRRPTNDQRPLTRDDRPPTEGRRPTTDQEPRTENQEPKMDDEPATQNSTLKTQNFGGALAIKEALMRRGVLVRYYRKPGLDDCIRVSVGTPAQNDALLAALTYEL